MRKLLDLGLKQIEKILQEMGGTVLECVNSLESVLGGEGDSIEDNSSKLHILRNELVEIATELLVRYQPMASDLRYIQASIDVSYDLYRISRYSMEIERTLKITNPGCEFERSKQALKIVKKMVELALRAFLEGDETSVGRLLESDEKVDKLYLASIEELNKDSNICKAVEALILRHLERMSDHTTYIGGSAIYVIKGERI
ncbi:MULTISPECIES: phosphate uptake regulator PhoU [Thermococcus]|uniref:Phosphate transport system regulator n=2 Tax=Thermococcus sibiricus TaxID=172049 RepID=C5ZZU3_THESM|nr:MULTISPECIES: phosphate uptake regulator PhoU [Thermococcus]KUK29143.1 MAG: Phosphate transport system regulator [Thermococcus sp. 40_45]HII66962.1 phosphate uptake regulator PhoU [Thermococcaceae archaeon]ACS90924.1 Phosphate transport system regulator [Thermococcus sibiricus MM 739]KUK18502.1 MAG: Phosphate transport system regulator [Thermococcus sibiricus]MBC7094058.1 phosphate uptake regulator PhoU [Thermococcus sp.]